MAQILSARAFVIDALPKRQHLPEPVVSSARGEPERIARFPNCLAFDKDQAVEFRLLRLRRMVDPSTEAAVYHETSLAFRIHTTPRSGTRTVTSPALRFSSAEDARRIVYGGANSIPREDEVEQRVQKMLSALLQITRPYNQGALRVGGRY